MNEATRIEVNILLRDATYEGLPAEERRGKLETLMQTGFINLADYLQLLDAINTHNDTGSYEGCIIWRNAEAKPLADES